MFGLNVQPRGHYVLLAVSGTADAAEFCAAHSFMAEWVRRSPCDRVLVDMLGVQAQIAPEGAQLVLDHLEATMPPLSRIAIVVDPRIAHNLVMQAAMARGIPVREFDNAREAQEWLDEPSDA